MRLIDASKLEYVDPRLIKSHKVWAINPLSVQDVEVIKVSWIKDWILYRLIPLELRGYKGEELLKQMLEDWEAEREKGNN